MFLTEMGFAHQMKKTKNKKQKPKLKQIDNSALFITPDKQDLLGTIICIISLFLQPIFKIQIWIVNNARGFS